MNQGKELAKAKAELTKLQQAKEKAKEKEAKCKERKEGGEVDGEGPQHGNSSSTIYRRAQVLEEILRQQGWEVSSEGDGGSLHVRQGRQGRRDRAAGSRRS